VACALKRSEIGRPCGHYTSRRSEKITSRLLQTSSTSCATLSGEARLSLVAAERDQIVGHVMFSPSLLDAPKRLLPVQVLSPIGVVPERQNQGSERR
jgi:hypothetical protein